MTARIRRSSGNVFRDLGFSKSEAENLRVRSELMIELTKLIEARKLTKEAAAKLLGVTRSRVSDVMRGRIDRFSVDTLIEMLGHAGVSVTIVIDYLGERAKRGSREKFEAALASLPDVEPEDYDKL